MISESDYRERCIFGRVTLRKRDQRNLQIRANTCACTALTYVTVIPDTYVLPTFAVTRAVN